MRGGGRSARHNHERDKFDPFDQCDQIARWFFFNICPFSVMKICPIKSQIAKVCYAFCQIRNKPSKICLTLLNFCQNGKISPNLVTLPSTDNHLPPSANVKNKSPARDELKKFATSSALEFLLYFLGAWGFVFRTKRIPSVLVKLLTAITRYWQDLDDDLWHILA